MPATIQTIQKPTRARALDTSGNNNHGQIYSGRALEFDGVSDYLMSTMTTSMDEKSAITLSTWVKVDDLPSSDEYILELPEAVAGTNGCGFRIDGTNFIFDIVTHSDTTVADESITYDYQKDTWYRLILTYDGTTGKGYVNGVLADSDTVTVGTGIKHASSEFFIGDFSDEFSRPFAGKIADVQVWDTAWTAEDVLYDYNNPEQLALNRGGTSLTNSNLKIWYPMNDGHRGQQSYILDASNTGLSDELLADTDVNDSSAWNGTGGSGSVEWTFSNGEAYTTGSAQWMTQSSVTTHNDGYMYKSVVRAKRATAGVAATMSIYHGGNSLTMHDLTDDYVDYTTYMANDAGSGSDHFYIYNYSGNVKVTSASLKKINAKNHATTVFYGDMNGLLHADKKTALADALDSTNDSFDFATGATDLVISDGFIASNATFVNTSGAGRLTNTASSQGHVLLEFITVVGRTYQVHFDVITVSLANLCNVSFGSSAAFNSSNQAVNKGVGTGYSLATAFVADDTTSFLCIQNSSSTNTRFIDIDNIREREEGTASGWTDADQQLDIPQTALQSYNQLLYGFDESNSGFDAPTCVKIDSDSAFNFGTNSFSASVWFRRDGDMAGVHNIFRRGGWSGVGYSIAIDSAENLSINFSFGTGSDNMWAKTAATIEKGKWYHAVGVWNRDGDQQLYLNGEKQTMADDYDISGESSETMDSTNDLFLYTTASDSESAHFPGVITELSLWKIALNQAMIDDLYNDGKAINCLVHGVYAAAPSYLRGYWRNNGLAQWKDETNNDNHSSEVDGSETMLITAGVDGSRDSQGFLMNRQRATNCLNLYQNDTNTYGSAVQINTDGADETTTGIYDSTGDGLGNFTVEFWFKVEKGNGNNQILFQSAYQDGSDWIGLDINMDNTSGAINTVWYTEGGDNSSSATWATDTSSTYLDGKWHFFSVSVDRKGTIHSPGTARCVMVIDKNCKSVVSGATISDEASSIAFGRYISVGGRLPSDEGAGEASTNRYSFEGQLDEVRVYKEALTSYEAPDNIPEDGDEITSGEVLRNYNAGKRSHR